MIESHEPRGYQDALYIYRSFDVYLEREVREMGREKRKGRRLKELI